MEILFKNEIIGRIENMYSEEYWVHGDFIPYELFNKYKKFFNAVVCETGMDETQFDKELFDENNWYIKREEELKGIWIPAIYEDGDISIRYR